MLSPTSLENLPVATPLPRNTARNVAIWKSETEYFDSQAAAAAARVDAGMAPEILERYRDPARPWFNKEYRFRLLGNLEGLKVLDVGCGMGENAVLLASRGARVTGIDVSPRSIEAARRLAGATPLPRPPEFICSPIELAELPERSFDVIWGDGVLHHVLHDMEGILERCLRLGRDGALVVFSEPVDRVPGLRLLRKLVPIELDGTPNERPLLPGELRTIRRHVPDLRLRAFSFLGRLNRLVLPGGSLERATPARRVVSDALTRFDAAVLSVPLVSRLGGMVVMVGHVRR